jgi:tetratricopeptide (TPR) repeat protein
MQVVQERDRARVESQKTKQVTTLLLDLFDASDISSVDARRDTVPAGVLLFRGAERVREQVIENPEVRSAVLGKIGHIFVNLDIYGEGEKFLRESLELGNPNNSEYVANLSMLAMALWKQGDLEESERLQREALGISRRIDGHGQFGLQGQLLRLADIVNDQGRYEEAEKLYRQSIDVQKGEFPEAEPPKTAVLNRLLENLFKQKKYVRAKVVQENLLALQRKQLQPAHPDIAISTSRLAFILRKENSLKTATQLDQRALEIWKQMMGKSQPDIARGLHMLTRGFLRDEDHQQLRRVSQRATTLKQLLVEKDRHWMGALRAGTEILNLAGSLTRLGYPAEAESIYRMTLALQQESNEIGGVMSHYVRKSLAEVLRKQGKYREAEQIRENLLVDRHEEFNESLANALRNLSSRFLSRGKSLNENPVFERLILLSQQLLVEHLGPGHPITLANRKDISELYTAWGQPDKASRFRTQPPK